jgi:hypothetical protein
MPAHLLSSEYNPNTGLTEEYWHDPAQGTITIKAYQDCEAHNKACRNEFNGYSSKGHHNFNEGIGRRVASVTPAQVAAIKKETGVNLMTATNEQVRSILNNRDYFCIRTAPGRV